jgi:hypothetical protein
MTFFESKVYEQLKSIGKGDFDFTKKVINLF